MKLSNEQENILNIITTILFFLGIILFLKIGFINWIIFCSIIYFFIVKDEKFIATFYSPEEPLTFPTYGIIWFVAILMPIVLILMYLGGKITENSQGDDD